SLSGGSQTAGGAGTAGSESTGGAGSQWTGGLDGYNCYIAGGSGYYGGGGGGTDPYIRWGAGGGSGYYDPTKVFSAILTRGERTSPGNAADTMRGGSGQPAVAGRLILGDPSANLAPVAANDTATAEFNTATTVSPLANDTDANGDTLSVASVGSPSHGTTSVSSGTTILYTPTTGYSGSDSFSYTISDGRGASATATISMTVRTLNHAPVAVNDTTSTPSNVAQTFDPRTNDTDPDGDNLTVSAVGTPGHGTVTIGSGGANVVYTAAVGYLGADSFTYTVSDGRGGSSIATVSVDVTAPTNTWSATAKSSSISLSNGNLTASNTASCCSDRTARAEISRTSGKVRFEVTVTGIHGSNPYPGIGIANGSAQFNTYLGVDANSIAIFGNGMVHGNGTIGLSNTGITYGLGNTIAVEVDFDSRLIYFQKSGGTRSAGISFSFMSGAIYPAVTLLGVGDVVTANFGATPWIVPPSTAFDPNAPNAAPVAVNDNAVVAPTVAATLSPLLNDTDANGDPLTISAVGTPSHGSVTIDSGLTTLAYTPTGGYSGSDSFTYTVVDGRGGSATATFNVSVSAATNILIVGGGGGAAGAYYAYTASGGGGGGEVKQFSQTVAAGSYSIVVGSGGAGKTGFNTTGDNGGSSSALGVTALGGGGSGTYGTTGANGANGGGAGAFNAPTNVGTSTSGHGFSGGNGTSAQNGTVSGGGGGGEGGGGANAAASLGGAGGPGVTSSISGSTLAYGSGGGGGSMGTGGAGGSGAGTGASGAVNGSNAVANRGGGGGGSAAGANPSISTTGGNGGSGVVIIAHPTGVGSATGGTITTAGGYTIHTFTSDGTYTVSP
ncbi:MAG: Ig-like domain-containing protein, partial [Phenylobacterium sp.]|uniref:Ig-like domain-containing protein n=1 Tax=Phenylobacterium sp. TaxID=1871053 RepID=UPI003BB60750